jgi:hypothetical protein
MVELATAMSQKLAESLEGEYKTSFGTIVVRRTDGGYKIVIHIDDREIGKNLARQIALSVIGPYLARERIA